MIDEHATAALALLEAVDGPPALVVHDGRVPVNAATRKTDPPPYVVVYFSGSYPDLAFRGVVHTFQLRITLHCVGGNAAAARQVSDRGMAALLDVTPVVAGRNCFPIRFEDSQPPQRDESTGQLVMDQIDTYVLRSVPA